MIEAPHFQRGNHKGLLFGHENNNPERPEALPEIKPLPHKTSGDSFYTAFRSSTQPQQRKVRWGRIVVGLLALLGIHNQVEIQKQNQVVVEQRQEIDQLQQALAGINTVETADTTKVMLSREMNASASVRVQTHEGEGIGSSRYIGEKHGAYYYMTAYHVIEDAEPQGMMGNMFDPTMRTGVAIKPFGSLSLIPAEVVGVDAGKDLALLRTWVRPPHTPKATFRDMVQDPVTLGEEVYAIGAPIAQHGESVISQGIISSKNPYPLPHGDGHLTDANIIPGNSGGWTVDTKGNILGMNIAVPIQRQSAVGERIQISIDTLSGYGIMVPAEDIQAFLKKAGFDLTKASSNNKAPKIEKSPQ